MIDDITAVILAGGQSRRIGTDKAFLRIGRQTFIEIILRKLAGVFDLIFISAKDADKYRPVVKSHPQLDGRLRIIRDRCKAGGSLVGIYSALKSARTEYIFVTACDMPLISTGLIRRLMRYYRDYDVVIPRTRKGLEPLFAIYSRNCLKPIKGLIDAGNLKIIDFFPRVRVKELRMAGQRLFNINTRKDYNIL